MTYRCLDPFCKEHPKRFQRPFRCGLAELQAGVHRTAIEKGWWEDKRPDAVFAEKIALMHSELSEALEAWRDPENVSEDWPVELADCVIRIMDIFAANHLDLQTYIEKKAAYNRTRPYRHGGKRI